MHKNASVYYHYFCTPAAMAIFDRTISEVINSGLYRHLKSGPDSNCIIVNVVGVNYQEEIQKLISKYHQYTRLVFKHYRSRELKDFLNSHSDFEIKKNPHLKLGLNGLEGDTLELLWNDLQSQTEESNVLYLHSKGAVNTDVPSTCKSFPNREKWRETMSKFVIDSWEDRLLELDIKNHSGALFIDHYKRDCIPHYKGNFWWARSSYLRNCISFVDLCKNNYLVDEVEAAWFKPFLAAPFWLAEYWMVHGAPNLIGKIGLGEVYI
jgi:hypothetical protein